MRSALEQQAKGFATTAHASINQRRKYTGEPYIVHPAAVVELVRSVPHDEAMLAAGWLHDVVEDTPITIDDIGQSFGEDVRDLVGWLTDVSRPEDGNRKTRKAIDRDHLAQAPARAQTIKVADLIDNSRTILVLDPGFAWTYLSEKKAVLDVLVRADPALTAQARVQIETSVQAGPGANKEASSSLRLL